MDGNYTKTSAAMQGVKYWVSLVRGSFLASTKANPHEGYGYA